MRTVNLIHTYLASAAFIFVIIHLVTLYADYKMADRITLLGFFLPEASPYRTTLIDVGIIPTYLFLIILVTSWVRKRVGFKLWRTIHYFNYLALMLAIWHSMLGQGEASVVPNGFYIWSGAILLGLSFYRIVTRSVKKKIQ
ncbi:ferric reductase-like transmembrane domain-containing protein [Neobacillus ginsengisoli]|nr:ferric reductase-like transmembrane domain-containing protein [Neobacillus ginsengisoli]